MKRTRFSHRVARLIFLAIVASGVRSTGAMDIIVANNADGGNGLSAYIANCCVVKGGTTNITYKYNMP